MQGSAIVAAEIWGINILARFNNIAAHVARAFKS
jgi:hypothetical protein